MGHATIGNPQSKTWNAGSPMNPENAKKIVQRIAGEKQQRLNGGGADFLGALKRLVGIWSEPAHALVELLQNADDVNATRSSYEFFKDGVLFRHNGSAFTEKQVEAICSVDSSTKNPETHIGF